MYSPLIYLEIKKSVLPLQRVFPCSRNWLKQVHLCLISIKGENVDWSTGAANNIILSSTIGGTFLVMKINYNHSDVIMKMPPRSLFYFLYVIISHLSFLCSLLNSSSHQSLSNPLQVSNSPKDRQANSKIWTGINNSIQLNIDDI